MNLYYLEDIILQMITRFMDYVQQPFPGYKLKSQFTKIISLNPSGGGRLFRDPNGRPGENVLSALYLGTGPKYHEAVAACEHAGRYPGKLSYTTMENIFDPYYVDPIRFQ